MTKHKTPNQERKPVDVTLRTGTPDDAPAAMDLIAAAIKATTSTHYTEREKEDWLKRFTENTFRERLHHPDRQCIIAETPHQMLALGVRKGPVIEHLFVHPAASGQGLASSILAELEKQAIQEGHHTVILEASRNASAFYRRHGYQETATPGCDSLCARMEKTIAHTEVD